ncbi:hypothetical protein QBC40DRAFT_280401 [Triangularia verruculosa]|uniref:Uncharacterized protein n=1 Tax=Triangularia verruculosa TaxID=2587418 RepID=A0AAN7AV17_9PEZI|nr:hypothetical protein QBC40DRAFT_280401 [Triangularia verruculosa]
MAPSRSASAGANVTFEQPSKRLLKRNTSATASVSFEHPPTGKRPPGHTVNGRPSVISFEQPPQRRPIPQRKPHQSLPVYPAYPTHAVELDSKEIGRAISTSIPSTTWTSSPQPLEQGILKPQPPPKEADGLYGVCISELVDNGITIPLEPSGGRAWVVSSVLDLGLRMLESTRGREALDNLAQKSLTVWRERPVSYHAEIVPKSFNTTASVDEFLYTVRHNFPLIKLDPKRNGFLADPSTTSIFAFYRSPSLSQPNLPQRFNPKAAAVLHLNANLATKLYHSRLKSDICRRHKRTDEALAQTARFRRLGFHIAAMVTHHLCHLFVNFLRDHAQEGELRKVTDGDFMRLVTRYDPGAEWEVEFFGGRPKLFIDWEDGGEDSEKGESFIIKRGGNDRRMAAKVASYKVESYLRGDFSIPLLTEVEGEVFPMEKYQDVKRRYGNSKLTDCHHDGHQSKTRLVVDQPLGLPWNIKGQEYHLLKQACFDPTARVVSPMRVRTIM